MIICLLLLFTIYGLLFYYLTLVLIKFINLFVILKLLIENNMNYFETKMVKLIKDYFLSASLKGICTRNQQSRYVVQNMDIVVDSKDLKFHGSIECKTLKTDYFYFKRYFHSHQIDTISNYLDNSGRVGLLAIYYNKKIFMIPWSVFKQKVDQGYKKLVWQELLSWELRNISDLFLLKEY